MNRILPVITAAIVTCAGFSSCEKIVRNLANAPTFDVADSLYDGQNCKLRRFRYYTYSFTCDNEKLVTISNVGKDWHAYIHLDGAAETQVTFRSKNETVTDDDYTCSKDVRLFPWNLEAETCEDDTVRVYMYAVDNAGNNPRVRNGGIWTAWNSTGKLTWSYDAAAVKLVKEDKTKLTVIRTDKSKPLSVKASLGEVQHSISID